MTNPGAATIAIKLRGQVLRWQNLRGELAEVQKAEAQARVEGVEFSTESTITARREAGNRQALEFTKEAVDLKADVEIAEKWMWFYALLLTEGITIEVSECP